MTQQPLAPHPAQKTGPSTGKVIIGVFVTLLVLIALFVFVGGSF